ncbi:pilus assembly protein TadG-related protein [Salipiger marinus]|uniref:pilus assembly protein TadG-related protein n=1 Tax=Salipiger marinus TaxID=555512 RepID=UPI0040598213
MKTQSDFGDACPRTETAASALLSYLRRWRRDESGFVSILVVAVIMVMLVFGGIGIDMMYAELQRTKLQNTLDRAVLAATDLDQSLDPEAVVTDYMERMALGDALVSVDVDDGLNYRTVTAEGRMTATSNVLRLLGVDTLQVDALAQATERFNKVEISLVVDISGSMDDGDKLEELQAAAKDFVDTLLDEGNEDLVSISLVPYSEHVNAGPEILSYMNVNWRHGYSHCIEMPNSAFASTTLDYTTRFDQMQHFQWNYNGSNSRSDTICPRYDYERITAFSQNRTALKAQIDQLQPRAGTSIFMGMKWGTALLDPSAQRIASGMIAKGKVDPVFEGRPVAYDDEEVLKTVVLMTDGQHDRSYRIRSGYYDSDSEYAHWDRYNLWYYLQNYVRSSSWGNFYYQRYDSTLGDSLLDDICDAAKRKGILIWTIGFEVTDHGANVMRNCASSPSHFFRVEGVEISEAFSTIAHTLNQLRLTQ